ncbi:MAG: 23S rRNA (adenine(2503)-C(2))-methyltransferase RlmN [Candidatus Peribacteria bacterium]|nr:MAG: 23S rRNA (adenine(2503)-C(2))-methyltransferase RlmN [Candidatus Peribacteria bacterium]
MIETVLMYHYHTNEDTGVIKLNRVTLCISSQVGCAVGCIFCVTGTLGLLKNLHRTEILAQVIYANNYLKQKLGKKEDGSLWSVRNVVFMGMGEPLMNYPNVKKVCEFLSSEYYFGLSSKRITVSTSGVYQGLEKFITDNLPVSLAFSLHAPNQELRAHLVPMAKFYTLDKLMELMDEYVRVSDRQVFYEYVMIRDENDTDEVAHQLGRLLRNRRGHLNLIPYNQNPAIDLHESDPEQIKRFKKIVESYDVTVTIRQNMGRKEKSACGQLGYEAAQEKLKHATSDQPKQ